MDDIVKICKIHGELTLDKVRVKNENNIRCKDCARDSTKRSQEKHRERNNKRNRDRRKNDPEYAAGVRARDREYHNRIYPKIRDEQLRKRREFYAQNPDFRRAIHLKKYKLFLSYK